MHKHSTYAKELQGFSNVQTLHERAGKILYSSLSQAQNSRMNVSQCCADGEAPFKMLGKVTKAHARIIWSVSCTDLCFATGSRDHTVKLWALQNASKDGETLGRSNCSKLADR